MDLLLLNGTIISFLYTTALPIALIILLFMYLSNKNKKKITALNNDEINQIIIALQTRQKNLNEKLTIVSTKEGIEEITYALNKTNNALNYFKKNFNF